MNLVLGLSVNSVRLCEIVLSDNDCGSSYVYNLRCATSNGLSSKTLLSHIAPQKWHRY